MSAAITAFLVRIFIGGALCAVVLILTGDGPQREIMRLCCAAFMVIVVFTAFRSGDFSLDIDFSALHEDTQQYVDDALEQAERYQFSSVTGQLSNYIEEKAQELGVSCKVALDYGLNEKQTYQVTQATVSYMGELTQDQLEQLAKLMETDCGIDRQIQAFERSGNG